ncbi:cardiolipin synthase [Tropicimonas sp. IMCC34043]|uniref:cardiolipin synthase n=1 Tax=Tropicimonas sp. IMCC34043 TaxID=2248760 RepID=UPI000E2219F3|nr:cardiolipin synthase [Tropicimonas sp. IMCC34043]
MWITLYALGYFLLEVTAIWFAYRAVARARTPQGSIAWILFLILTPVLAVPAFLVLGHFNYPGYVIARRDSAEAIAEMDVIGRHCPAKGDGGPFGLSAFEGLARLPVVSGNTIDLLIDGETILDALCRGIDAAESYVLSQFYILRDDETGRIFADSLKAAVTRGVSVRLLYDSVGCAGLSQRYLDDLKAGGVEVVDANRIYGPKNRLQMNFRNHRKSVIVDGREAYTGGMNIGDEYRGLVAKYGDWRDTFCRLRGPAVQQLQLVFLEDWHWATKTRPSGGLNWEVSPTEGAADALVLASGPGDPMETGSLYFCACITRARKRLWIASPYFVPDIDILSALKIAALRGVDVRILVPEIIDHKVTWLAAFAYFDEVRAAGVQIWRYTPGFLHQKIVLVDDELASIGTTNMDNRSCRLNFEQTVLVFDKAVAAEVARMLEDDFTRAYLLETDLSGQPWSRRVGAPFARLLAPIL